MNCYERQSLFVVSNTINIAMHLLLVLLNFCPTAARIVSQESELRKSKDEEITVFQAAP